MMPLIPAWNQSFKVIIIGFTSPGAGWGFGSQLIGLRIAGSKIGLKLLCKALAQSFFQRCAVDHRALDLDEEGEGFRGVGGDGDGDHGATSLPLMSTRTYTEAK